MLDSFDAEPTHMTAIDVADAFRSARGPGGRASASRHARTMILPVLAERLRRRPPQVVVTCARGSSAHAATFGKHLIERYLGIVGAAAAPNIATIYHQRLRLDGQFFLAISQSGESGDIIEQAAAARACGAVTACVTNDPESALAQAMRIRPADGGRPGARHSRDQDLRRVGGGSRAPRRLLGGGRGARARA